MADPNSKQRPELDDGPGNEGLACGLTHRQVVRPLWFILAGSLICCFSFGVTINSLGHNAWKIRLTDAPVGVMLAIVGIWQLGRIDIDRDYARMMRLIFIVAVLQFAKTISDVFPLPQDPVIALARIFISVACIAADIEICTCMCWFCRDTGLWRSAKGWQKTTTVFCCSSVPFALFDCLMLLVVLQIVKIQGFPITQPSSSWPWSWWYLLLIPFIVAPPLAFALSILKMGREMSRRSVRGLGMMVPVSPLVPSSGD